MSHDDGNMFKNSIDIIRGLVMSRIDVWSIAVVVGVKGKVFGGY